MPWQLIFPRSLLHVHCPQPRYWKKRRRKRKKERKKRQPGGKGRTFLQRRARLCAIGRAFSRGSGRCSRIYSPRSIAVYYSSIGGGTALWQLSPQRFSMIREFHRSAPTDGWWRISRRINGPLLFYRGGKCRSSSPTSLGRWHAVTTHCCAAKLSPRLFPRHRNPLATMRHLWMGPWMSLGHHDAR